MKMLPVQLSLNPPLGLWSDMLWRCPPAPPSQLAELKTQLPPSLPSDPRLWSREDVAVFLHFCEREFDLPKVDYDLFQMNGKALCLLTRADFGHRCPGAGDVLHNVLQMLVIESHMMQWHLPNSPVTPTSRYPLSPHSHPPTPTWPPIGPPESAFHQTSHLAPHHFMAPNSVTLSPPPSVDSQASSPPQSQEQQQHQQQQQNGNSTHVSNSNSSSSSSSSSTSSTTSSSSASAAAAVAAAALSASNAFGALKQHNATSASSHHSDSDEESYSEPPTANSTIVNFSQHNYAAAAAAAAVAQYNNSPPTTPILKDMPQSLKQQIKNTFVNSWSQQQQQHQQHQQQQQQQHQQQQQQQQHQLQQQHQQQQQQQQMSHDQKLPLSGSVSAPTTPSYMQPVKREFFPDKTDNRYMQPVKREFFPENTEPNTNGRLLWDFLQQLLNDRNQKYSDLIAWKCRDTGVFKIVDPAGLAKLWGIQKNHLSMNYDKMSRALRYYYRVNILRKVQGERHCYQFLRNPTELKNIKNISLLRQSVNQNNNANNNTSNGNPTTPSAALTTSPSTNGTNWAMPAQGSLQHPGAAQQQQTPQRASSQSNNNNHLTLPNGISSAAAAVAAAAAAAYGPPPSSPLFMHAINGAFHYLSSNGVPPNSPAALPTTPNDKFQFNVIKAERQQPQSPQDSGVADEMKPTDLSVSGNNGNAASTEKRPYSSPSANDDCYPLIRNADGLTTIKLIRYNENESVGAQTTIVTDNNENTQQQHQQQQQQQQQQCNTPTPMDSESSDMGSSPSHDNMGATDLRK